MRKPNFFLVGAPRCGTTAIFRWLREQPQVYLPPVKECHYFATDFGAFRSVQSQAEYLRLFEPASEQHPAVGEASVMYLVSETALDNIAQFNSEANLLVALRNPIELVHSWHEQLLVTFQEDEPDFELAWQQQASRLLGRNIPDSCTIPQALQYANIGRLGTQVRRLVDRFDRAQIHFIVYDDLVRDSEDTCARMLEAIGVRSPSVTPINRVNQNQALRVGARHWHRNRALIAARRFARSLIGDKYYERIRDAVMAKAAVRRERTPLSPSCRQMLVDTFQPEVEELSDLVGRDFRHWLAA